MEYLKPCPFCGQFAKYVFNGTEGFVECCICRSRGPKYCISDEICVKDKAIEDWEKRFCQNGSFT